jgi:hypothetical protein
LSGCGPTIKANGGIAVEEPDVPESSTATEGDVAALLIEQRDAIRACNANFPN